MFFIKLCMLEVFSEREGYMSTIIRVFKEDKSLIYIVLFTIAVRILYYNCLTYPLIFPDTSGYVEFDFNQPFDNGRTFVYPAFLKCINIIFSVI